MIKKIFKIEYFTKKSKYLFLRILFFKIPIFYFYLGKIIVFYWYDEFVNYFKNHNMQEKVSNLKKGLDEISCEYIDNFMRLFKYHRCIKKDCWTKEDLRLKKEIRKIKSKCPYKNILKIDPLFFINCYGISDLEKDVFRQIDGKIIIDGGGLNGDSALMFHHFFKKSKIDVYEPLTKNVEKINKILSKSDFSGKINPIKMGLGDRKELVEIKFNYCEVAQIDRIDDLYKNSNESVGLIKLDTEGYETKIIQGAIQTIKKYKPVLVVAMYHTPYDFFELKEKIEKLNLGYKFMIRRSEMVLPQADLVLIAY